MKKKSPTKRWRNSDLLEFFDIYNTKYFGGKLEQPCDIRFSNISQLGKTVRIRQHKRRSKDDTFSIHIGYSVRSSRRLWGTTLLHEMVHYKQRNRFDCGIRGRTFNREMKRLAAEGAFDGLW